MNFLGACNGLREPAGAGATSRRRAWKNRLNIGLKSYNSAIDDGI
jgi:hypothetical protein